MMKKNIISNFKKEFIFCKKIIMVLVLSMWKLTLGYTVLEDCLGKEKENFWLELLSFSN
jgi:hypothetical protein